jgi:branched-chain amino acid aminotransferase
MEVKRDGYEEALMLDTQGFVSEASAENIFMIRGSLIKTTPLTSVLDGITRDSIKTIATDMGYAVVEQLFTRDELYGADEVFFCGTAAELTPVREIDNRTIGMGKIGPITEKLQTAYFNAIKGKDPAYEKWLFRYTL